MKLSAYETLPLASILSAQTTAPLMHDTKLPNGRQFLGTCPPSEFHAPVSFGALKARQVRRRIAAGFYDRPDVARETARRILSEMIREI